MCASRLLASCCLVCLLAPIASLGQPQSSKATTANDSSPATVSVRQLRIPDRAKAAFNKGTQKLAAKDYPGCIAEFEKAIAAYDDFYEAYYKIGIANLELQASEAAEAAFRRSIALSESKYTPALFGMGLALASQKQYGDAEAYVRAGLQIEPTSPSGLLALGWVLLSAQRVVEAEKAAREAVLDDLDAYLRLDPDSARSRALRTSRDAAQQTVNRDTPPKSVELPEAEMNR